MTSQADRWVAALTIVDGSDLDYIEEMLLHILNECRKGEHKFPKRWEIGEPAK